MPTFKYVVANKEGKKLSGTVEAPDENTAKSELNNLGFSVLNIEKSTDQDQVKSGNKFIFEAIDKQSKKISGTVPAKNEEEAFEKLKKEYDLTVTAIYKENATEKEIAKARQEGTEKIQNEMLEKEQAQQAMKASKQHEDEKEKAFVGKKIDLILKKINELLNTFGEDIGLDKRAEINRRIDKILRIKNSTNYQYIQDTAEALLRYIKEQEEELKNKGLKEKQLALNIKTNRLLSELHRSSKPQSLGEDILNRIEQWKMSHPIKENTGQLTKFTNSILTGIKEFFETPTEIQEVKEQIKVYNKQLWDFALLYFKESGSQYRQKIKNSLKAVWKARKNAKKRLSQVKEEIAEKHAREHTGDGILASFVEELNSLSGWILSFYLAYYFVGLYFNNKDFGLTNIPKELTINNSQIFKYLLAVLFLLHISTALKINFFKKSKIAGIILIPFFIFGSIISLLNF